MKPMLAGKVTDVSALRWPVLCTPKIDGIRCLTATSGSICDMADTVTVGLSRKLKPIPNRFVQESMAQLPVGLDGELWVPGATCFGDVSAAIMRRDGEPRFEYLVFDHYDYPGHYAERVRRLTQMKLPGFVEVLCPRTVHNASELLRYEEYCLADGHEGVMLRAPNGPYKHGRSTEREGWLLKFVRWERDEAVVVGTVEYQHNGNEATVDALGHTKRSTAKAGKTGAGILGKFIVERVDGVRFEIGAGPGLTLAMREELWKDREALIGATVSYKHRPHGAKDRPRFPQFMGFRSEDDMGDPDVV